jgi:hypothetical protein
VSRYKLKSPAPERNQVRRTIEQISDSIKDIRRWIPHLDTWCYLTSLNPSPEDGSYPDSIRWQ